MQSKLEHRFALLWRSMGGPALEREFRFHPMRKWRADFAHLPSRTLIEIEGGIWVRGRHTTPRGFTADAEKYLEAALGGWRVLRLVGEQIKTPTVTRIIDLCVRWASDTH
jgi:very-short-patch-repair endonuclease